MDQSHDQLISRIEALQVLADPKLEWYFVIHDLPSTYPSHPLDGLFFKAKSPHGVVVKIYHYMQENKIPHFIGPKEGLLLETIGDLIGTYDYDIIRFIDKCYYWIDQHTTFYTQVKFV